MIGKDGRNYPDRKGANSSCWRGGIQTSGNGYLYKVVYGHPRADARGRVLVHTLIAEEALGKPLPEKAVVHHVNTFEKGMITTNLVLCEDQGYHNLLHRRQRAYEVCGHPDWLQCRHCREWDSPENMTAKERKKEGVGAYHKSCHAQAEKQRLSLRRT